MTREENLSARPAGIELFKNLFCLGYQVNWQRRENLEPLKQNPDAPAVIYFNHIAADDPLIAAYFLLTELEPRSKLAIFPVSEHYLHLKNHPSYAVLVRLAENFAGFYMPPIVQSYRLRDPDLSEEERQSLQNLSFSLGRQFVKLVREKIPQGATIVIAPEGHRSEDGRLQQAEDGLGFLVKIITGLKSEGKINQGFFLPMGIWFEDGYKRGLNYHPLRPKRAVVGLGAVLELNEVVEETKKLFSSIQPTPADYTNFLMRQLAQLLPEEMRGVYSF